MRTLILGFISLLLPTGLAKADFILQVNAPSPIIVNSGVQSLDIRLWTDNNDLLSLFVADFSITGPGGAVNLTSPNAGVFGQPGMIGSGNLAGSSSFETTGGTQGNLNLDFLNGAQIVDSGAPGGLLARLTFDTTGLQVGAYTVNIDNIVAFNDVFDPISVTASGSFTAVPEPSSLVLVGLASAGAAGYFRKKKARKVESVAV